MSENYSVDYAFTITLKPKRMFQQEPEKQFDETMYHLVGLLESINSKYSMVIELTKSFNIHYHGVIKFPLHDNNGEYDCMKTFYSLFRKDSKIGYVYLKQVTEMSIWIEYLCKDLYKTNQCVGRPIIIKDDYNLFKQYSVTRRIW